MATDDPRPAYDDLAAIVWEIAESDPHYDDYGPKLIRTCHYCGRAMESDHYEFRPEQRVHAPDCLWVRAQALAARLSPADDRAAAAWADRVAMFILHKIVDADGDLTLSEIAPNLTAPHGWISFAKLWRADYIDVMGEFATPTEAGKAAMRDFAARLPPA